MQTFPLIGGISNNSGMPPQLIPLFVFMFLIVLFLIYTVTKKKISSGMSPMSIKNR